jgi:hypothetical protein
MYCAQSVAVKVKLTHEDFITETSKESKPKLMD